MDPSAEEEGGGEWDGEGEGLLFILEGLGWGEEGKWKLRRKNEKN